MDFSMSITWDELLQRFRTERQSIQLGGGEAAIARQHAKGRLTARPSRDGSIFLRAVNRVELLAHLGGE